MDRAPVAGIGLLVRIMTFAAMGAVIFVSALVLTAGVWTDLDFAIVGRDMVSWTDSEAVPMGAVMLSNHGREVMGDYIPLLGYVWWFGPLGFAVLMTVGLGIVYYSRHPRLPGSYLTPSTAVVGVAIALFGMAAAPGFVEVMYDEWAVTRAEGWWGWIHFVPLIDFYLLLLGCLLLGFAALFPLVRRERSGPTRG